MYYVVWNLPTHVDLHFSPFLLELNFICSQPGSGLSAFKVAFKVCKVSQEAEADYSVRFLNY